MNRERLFEKTKNQEGRAGVILKASRTGFIFATTSFISGYGGYPLRRSLCIRRQQTLTSGQLCVPNVLGWLVRSGDTSSSEGLKLARDFIRSNLSIRRGRMPTHISDMPSISTVDGGNHPRSTASSASAACGRQRAGLVAASLGCSAPADNIAAGIRESDATPPRA
jgi:hypothetical protein